MLTNIKQFLIFSVLVTVISVIAFTTQNVVALTIDGRTACESAPINGVWVPLDRTCTVTTLVIGSVDGLTIPTDVVLNAMAIINSGVITNNGQVNVASGGVITTSGKINNYGIIGIDDGTITNSGQFVNIGIVDSSGTITNGQTGVMFIMGSIINDGVITSSGNIAVNSTGILVNNGAMINTLNMINDGVIITSGTFTNSGPVTNIGDIWSSGLVVNNNSIINPGNIYNLCGGTVTDSGTIAVNAVIACVDLP